MDLSILIPARNEIFLGRTVEDILEHIEGKTEIIVVLDGYDIELPKLPNDPRVKILRYRESIGQRAATNAAARLSKAKYLIKVDAHCAFDQGFDVKMMADMQDNWTMAPTMRNLHIFDWVCEDGHRRYQGPSGPCEECGKKTRRDIVWIPKTNPQSNSYCFDSEPHFQYFGEYTKRPEGKGDITESMSLQGSFFMITRDKYWELNICDESFGSWGSQGIEVATKTWLSGGKVMINHKTWYAHCFRTQGGDFGFPYKLSGKQVERAKKHARELFFDNKWPKQIYPLSWLLERFWPVKGWTEEQLKELQAWPLQNKSVGVLYYSDGLLDKTLLKKVQNIIKTGANGKRIVSVTLTPMDFGENIVMDLPRSPITMFRQILRGLEVLGTDYVFFCEHDVFYHPSHFTFIPPTKDKYYYNMNCWQLREDGHAVYFDCKRLSQLCADRELLLEHYRKRIQLCEEVGFTRRQGYEPGTHGRPERVDDIQAEGWRSKYPNIDVRHEGNMTASRWHPSEFRSQKSCQNWKEVDDWQIEGWTKELLQCE